MCGRLVGEDERGVVHHRPGEGDPLLLTTGQLAGTLVRMVAERHLLEQSAARGAPAPSAPRSGRAVPSRSPPPIRLGTRLNAWKITPTERRRYSHFVAALEADHVSPADDDLSPCVGVSRPAKHRQQRGLAAAGRPATTTIWSPRAWKVRFVDGPGPVRSEGVLDRQPLDAKVGCGYLAPLGVRRLCGSKIRGVARHRTASPPRSPRCHPDRRPPSCGNIAFQRGV